MEREPKSPDEQRKRAPDVNDRGRPQGSTSKRLRFAPQPDTPSGQPSVVEALGEMATRGFTHGWDTLAVPSNQIDSIAEQIAEQGHLGPYRESLDWKRVSDDDARILYTRVTKRIDQKFRDEEEMMRRSLTGTNRERALEKIDRDEFNEKANARIMIQTSRGKSTDISVLLQTSPEEPDNGSDKDNQSASPSNEGEGHAGPSYSQDTGDIAQRQTPEAGTSAQGALEQSRRKQAAEGAQDSGPSYSQDTGDIAQKKQILLNQIQKGFFKDLGYYIKKGNNRCPDTGLYENLKKAYGSLRLYKGYYDYRNINKARRRYGEVTEENAYGFALQLKEFLNKEEKPTGFSDNIQLRNRINGYFQAAGLPEEQT